MVLHDIVTGTLPFRGSTQALVFDAILHQAPDCSRLPADLQPIVVKALERARELRYQAAADLRADLKRALRPVVATLPHGPLRPLCATASFPRPQSRLGSLQSQLFRVNLSTGEKRLITPNRPDAVEPHWSPHGYRLAFFGLRQGIRDIWTVSASGEGPVANPLGE